MTIVRHCLALFAGACLSLAAHAAPFDAWAVAVTDAMVRRDPELATQAQYFGGKDQDALDRRLTIDTPAAHVAELAAARTGLAQLARIDQAPLSVQQRASAAAIAWKLQGTLDAAPYRDHQFGFNQFNGVHVQVVNFMTQTHPVRQRRDVAHYLVRLRAVAGKIDAAIAQSRAQAGRGFLMPTFITQASIGQLDRFLSSQAQDNVFVAALLQRMAGLQDVTPAERTRFAAQAAAIVGHAVLPAFARARALLQEQLPRTTDDAGLWRLPDGDRAYAVALRQMTSSSETPAQVHATGLREVARIEQDMTGLLASLGYVQGSIKDRMARLQQDQQPQDADPRPQLLARYETVLRDAERRARDLFDLVPAAPVIVRREPSFTERTATAHYTVPARDGTRPGIFWAPLPGPDFNTVILRTMVYHEGVPGHHFQLALQQENAALPRYRRERVLGPGMAFGEGWGLYAEQLAAEYGWYGDDVVGRLGQLDAELLRARRLVVDTGLHAMRWTRQQAIDYGIPPAEVDRYVVMPGQACAYKIGMLRILALRARAQAALGARFDIRRFHNIVLETGNVPLPVLDQVIDAWIAREQAS
jgi:uncharacterized protein (DUF885 family)